MKHYSGWQTNLFVFALITVLVGGYFFWQTQQASRELENHSRDHSEILAAVVELTVNNALLSQDALEETVAGSLDNSARFIHYLDSIEPFSSLELTAYAVESGLAGVRIVQGSNSIGVSGPADWLPGRGCGTSGGLIRDAEDQLYLYTLLPEDSSSACVLLGISSREIDTTLDKISVERLLAILEDLHDIAYVRFQPDDLPKDQESHNSHLIQNDSIMETLVSVGNRQLIVALKLDRFGKRRAKMRQEFIVFICFLVLFGGFSSWWLYRLQRGRLQQTRDFERKMARQHEDAALGRAAATITHELRNPLNAIGMGLQRMQIEADNLDPDHHQLLASMRNAVDRTNTIITRLNQYIHSFEISSQPVNLASLLRQGLVLYQEQCCEQNIEVELQCEQDFFIPGDKILLEELFENILKNSVEAQVKGGFIRIIVKRVNNNCHVEIENGGFSLTPEESQLLFEPYFTRKSKGTGLGLVISKKIVLAHKGELKWKGDYDRKQIQFVITLPMEKS